MSGVWEYVCICSKCTALLLRYVKQEGLQFGYACTLPFLFVHRQFLFTYSYVPLVSLSDLQGIPYFPLYIANTHEPYTVLYKILEMSAKYGPCACLCACFIFEFRGAQIPGAISPLRRSSVRWRLIFVGPQCFLASFWCLEILSELLGFCKICSPLFESIEWIIILFQGGCWLNWVWFVSI
jgi:hypothetical protein